MNVNELIERSHAMATEKGWWPDGPGKRPVCELVNNFHAEISEAWEEWRAGRMDLWWSHPDEGFDVVEADSRSIPGTRFDGTVAWYSEWPGDKGAVWKMAKPEGFWVEVADLVIRQADTMGAMGWKLCLPLPVKGSLDQVLFIAECHSIVELMTQASNEWHHQANEWATLLIHACIEQAVCNGVDLLALCELKMSYNATRPHRHGGKLA
jgi:hypothetical protein